MYAVDEGSYVTTSIDFVFSLNSLDFSKDSKAYDQPFVIVSTKVPNRKSYAMLAVAFYKSMGSF